jgi:hypothetical protein
MSMKKTALLMGLMMVSGAFNTGTQGEYVKPEKIDPDAHRNGSQKQGQRKWRVNNVVVEAATKKAAIKKARKNPDYIERQGAPDVELSRWP